MSLETTSLLRWSLKVVLWIYMLNNYSNTLYPFIFNMHASQVDREKSILWDGNLGLNYKSQNILPTRPAC